MRLREKNKAVLLLEKYCEAVKQRDLALVLSLFTKDCHMWGTALDEYRVGLKAIETQHIRDWSQSEKSEIHIVSLLPMPEDALFSAAICKGVVLMNGIEHVFENLRGTIGIAKEAGLWKIAHMHASFPDFRNQENQSFPSV